MANTQEFFCSVTQRIFSNWTALRMAVEHGMGSKDRAVDFCPYITQVIYTNENISCDDVADELEQYMEAEFQTELQDNSAIEVGEKLIKFYHLCQNGNEEIAVAEMNKLPQLQSWILSRDEIKQRNFNSQQINVESSSDNEEENDNSMETTAPDAVEWTEVKTRRKK